MFHTVRKGSDLPFLTACPMDFGVAHNHTNFLISCNQSINLFSLSLIIYVYISYWICFSCWTLTNTDRNSLICTIPKLQTDLPPIHLHLLSYLTTEERSFSLSTACLSGPHHASSSQRPCSIRYPFPLLGLTIFFAPNSFPSHSSMSRTLAYRSAVCLEVITGWWREGQNRERSFRCIFSFTTFSQIQFSGRCSTAAQSLPRQWLGQDMEPGLERAWKRCPIQSHFIC